MGTRLLSAAIMIPVAVALLWFDPGGVSVFALILLLVGGTQWETIRIVNARGAALNGADLGLMWIVSFLWAAPVGLSGAFPAVARLESLSGPLLMLLLIGAFVRPLLSGRTEGIAFHAAAVLFGGVYLGWGFGRYGVALYGIDGGRWIFVLLGGVWACDSAAYFVGRAIGRHRLAPEISPNKTWEGAIAGLIGATLAAALLTRGLTSASVGVGVGAGLLVGFIAPLSDLVESALKRDAGVKDSGTLIPGHGGLLDRLDSLVFTTPVLYYYLQVLRIGF